MDAQNPDLSPLERRLSCLRPSSDGLAADALLFAAGRASAQASKGRHVWPALAGCFALLAAVLGGWVASERTERLALARQMQDRQEAGKPAPASTVQEASHPRVTPSPDSLLAARLSLAHDFDAWLASAGQPSPTSQESPRQFVPRAWQPGDLLDQ
jgi:hypothetical protein